MTRPSSVDLSVVIPTFNRADVLEGTLQTLVAQQGVDGRMEVVVIDDGSTDDTAATVARFADGPFAVRYVHQQNAGLNVGRNRGAAEARGPILAYLDDDVLLPSTWAMSVLEAFDIRPGLDAVAGRLFLRFESPPPEWLNDGIHHYLTDYDLGDEPRPVPDGDTPRGANFAIRATTLESLGGFLPHLDRKGTSLISNGEAELFWRLHDRGGEIWYWPAAWAYHRVHEQRLSKAWFRRRATAQGVGDAILDPVGSIGRRSVRVARELARMGRALPIAARGLTGRGSGFNADLWVRYCWARAGTFARPPIGDPRDGAA